MPFLAPITHRLAGRAPGMARRVRRQVWEARNFRRKRGFEPSALVDAELLAELRASGIAVREYDAVFRDREILERLLALAAAPPEESASPSKDFLVRRMPRRIGAESPYLALALEPQVVALANAYLGMRSYLRALDVWLNLPTPDPPKLSQLWHRDYDDLVNLKLFVYLSDVTDAHGPFTYAPGTQPGGPREIPAGDRLSDDELAELVPRDEWVVATGPPGTVVLADTGGYHKGGKPTSGSRLLWTAQFTSGAANFARNFELENTAGMDALSVEQRFALVH